MTLPKTTLIVLASLVLLPSQAAAQTPRAMTEAEVKAAGGRQLSGATIKQNLLGNTNYVLFLKPMGGIAAGTVVPIYHRDERSRTVKGGSNQKADSIWWIDGNTYCNEQRILNVGHQCYTNWQLADVLYSCLQPAGDCAFANRIVPGNAEKL